MKFQIKERISNKAGETQGWVDELKVASIIISGNCFGRKLTITSLAPFVYGFFQNFSLVNIGRLNWPSTVTRFLDPVKILLSQGVAATNPEIWGAKNRATNSSVFGPF